MKDASKQPTWADQILDALPSGVDPAQIALNLRLSPTERLERMRAFLLELETARDRGRGLRKAR